MALFKKDLPLQEWEKVEAQKQEQVRKIQEEIDALNAKRPGLLMRMAEDDPNALPELEKIEARIARLKLEAESIQEYLKVIPARKDYARGAEIEAVIPEIEKKMSEIPALVADINKKAAALAAANNKLFDFLGEFDSIPPVESLGLQSRFWDEGFSTLQNIKGMGAYGTVSTSAKPADLDIILMGSTYDKNRLYAWLDGTREAVAKRIEQIRDHARRLQGRETSELAIVYCPKCYKTDLFEEYGKYRCKSCSTTFDAPK